MEIDNSQILKYLVNSNVIKIKDNTTLPIDLANIAEQNSLKGIFVKTLLEKIEKEPENQRKLEKAIEIRTFSFLKNEEKIDANSRN